MAKRSKQRRRSRPFKRQKLRWRKPWIKKRRRSCQPKKTKKFCSRLLCAHWVTAVPKLRSQGGPTPHSSQSPTLARCVLTLTISWSLSSLRAWWQRSQPHLRCKRKLEFKPLRISPKRRSNQPVVRFGHSQGKMSWKSKQKKLSFVKRFKTTRTPTWRLTSLKWRTSRRSSTSTTTFVRSSASLRKHRFSATTVVRMKHSMRSRKL